MTKHENESKTRWEAGGPTEKVRVMTKEACVFSKTDVFVSCIGKNRHVIVTVLSGSLRVYRKTSQRPGRFAAGKKKDHVSVPQNSAEVSTRV